MLTKTMEAALNKQIEGEGFSSQMYLAMAVWAETKGFEGVAEFLYEHSDEERMHMLKLVKYVNERGGRAFVSKLEEPKSDYFSLKELFTDLLNHEMYISSEINSLIEVSMQEKDYPTNNFLQWFVAEQIEEEALARLVLDKLELIGEDKGGLYLFDRDIKLLHTQTQNKA